MKIIITFLLFITFCTNNLKSQYSLIKRTSHNPQYLYKNKFYTYKALKPIFDKNLPSKYHYDEVFLYRKAGIFSLATSALLFTCGLSEVSKIEEMESCPGFYCITGNHRIYATIAFVASGSFAVGSIIGFVNNFRIQKKSIDVFNEKAMTNFNTISTLSINFGIQQNGIGFSVIF